MPADIFTRLFSSDSHVMEPVEIWDGLLTPSFWKITRDELAPHPGGSDPHARIDAMSVDGVCGEVLYPTYGLTLFAIDDPKLQQACFRRYNEWLAEYCSAAPERLFGIGMIPTWDISVAIEELQFCADRGMRGCIVWQTPPPDLSFATGHYDPLWSAAQELGMPVSLHILTGFNYSRTMLLSEPGDVPLDEEGSRAANLSMFQHVRRKLDCVVDSLADLLFSGVFERFPDLRIVLVENEVGWLPFIVDQWDYYARDKREPDDPSLEKKLWPSDLVRRNVFVTYFRDPLAGSLAENWGVDNWMWSNDFPHPNSTWPHSRATVASQLQGLSEDTIERMTWKTAAGLYGIEDLVEKASANG